MRSFSMIKLKKDDAKNKITSFFGEFQSSKKQIEYRNVEKIYGTVAQWNNFSLKALSKTIIFCNESDLLILIPKLLEIKIWHQYC